MGLHVFPIPIPPPTSHFILTSIIGTMIHIKIQHLLFYNKEHTFVSFYIE